MKIKNRRLLRMEIKEIILSGYVSGFTNRALNYLEKEKVLRTLGDITKFSKEDFGKFRYMGPNAVNDIEKFLNNEGFRFRNEGEEIQDETYMNTYERYIEKTQKQKKFELTSEEAILMGIFCMIESESLFGGAWTKKTPEEKNYFMEDVLYRLEKWIK